MGDRTEVAVFATTLPESLATVAKPLTRLDDT